MKITGKSRPEARSVTGGQQAFYTLFGRREGADQDVSSVLQVNLPGNKTEDGARDLEQ